MFGTLVRMSGNARSRQALAAALISGWLAATTAAAGTIGISGNTLIVGAAATDSDVVMTGSIAGSDLLLLTGGAVFSVVTPGCVGAGANAFLCPLAGFTSLQVLGGNGHDVLDFSGLDSLGAILAGGAGNDILIGGAGLDTMYGGLGDDTLLDLTGTDLLFGGPGDDTVPIGTDLGEDNPVFEPLPGQPATVPSPGSLLLLLAGLGAAVLRRRGRSPAPPVSC